MVPLTIFGKKLKGRKRAVLCPLFPMVASHTLFNKTRSNILPQLLWISYNTNNYINTSVTKHKGDIINIFDSLKNNILTSVIDEKHRRELCIKWDLLTDKYQPTSFWVKTRIYCMSRLENEFADKRYWFLIKKEIDNFLINCY
ncbi:hypothetical protein O3M35_011630 [Rhynocoris fuscipes]|uniref:Uncharacterized protein n=1 Tax=Rhynocoris fuscipes TaxID=488301 RepID=A0AAW1D1H7_9HEMI